MVPELCYHWSNQVIVHLDLIGILILLMLLACVTLYFQMDLPRRGLKALLVYKIVFILETNCTDTFNLRQCVQHLAQFNDEEVLLAVVVYCVEKVRLDLALKVPLEHKTILFLK